MDAQSRNRSHALILLWSCLLLTVIPSQTGNISITPENATITISRPILVNNNDNATQSHHLNNNNNSSISLPTRINNNDNDNDTATFNSTETIPQSQFVEHLFNLTSGA